MVSKFTSLIPFVSAVPGPFLLHLTKHVALIGFTLTIHSLTLARNSGIDLSTNHLPLFHHVNEVMEYFISWV